MSDVLERAVPTVAFERHPAAIERHTVDVSARLPVPGARAIADLTTWFPVYSFGEPEQPDLVEAEPVALLPVALAPPQTLPDLEPAEPEPAAKAQAGMAQDVATPVPVPPLRPAPVVQAPVEATPAFDTSAFDTSVFDTSVFDTSGFGTPVPEPPRLSPAMAGQPEASAPETPVVETRGLEIPDVEAPGAGLPHEAELDGGLVHGPAPAVPSGRPERDLLWPGMPPLSRPFAEVAAPADGFWPSDPDGEALLRRDMRPPRLRPGLLRAAVAVGGLAVLAALGLAAVRLLPVLFGSGSSETAVFNAPMMVVRSAVTGRVMTVAANAGQIVEPTSRLLTIQSGDPNAADRLVLAGVHGVIRSVETVPGADLATGAPLVRMQDCDRAFLTISLGTKLKAGEAVRVKLPDLPPVAGTVRAASGIMEPPNALVVGLASGTMVSACPVGASAVVTPSVPG